MSWKTKPKNPSSKSCIVVFTIILIVQLISCTNPGVSQPIKSNWLTLNVKFKQNSTEQIRDTSLILIRNLLIDSVRAIKRTHPYYDPAISLISYPLEDALSFTFRITSDSYSKFKPVNLLGDTSTGGGTTLCTCNNGCKICLQIHQILQTPTAPGKIFLSDYVELITTDDY